MVIDSTGNQLSRGDIQDAVVEIITEFGPLGELGGVSIETTESASTQTLDEPEGQKSPTDKAVSKAEYSRWSGGEPLVKTVIATRRGYDHLGSALAAEAYHRGFHQVISQAFLGGGLKLNWSLWGRRFSHYTPITDLMHALSYVYSAATASG